MDYTARFEVVVQFEAGSDEMANERATDIDNMVCLTWGWPKPSKPKSPPRWLLGMDLQRRRNPRTLQQGIERGRVEIDAP